MRSLVVALLFATGCYSPGYHDCQLTCSTTCPSGLECVAGVCRPPGMAGACPTNTLDDAPTDSNELTVDDYSASARAGFCKRLVRCGAYETEAACAEMFQNMRLLDDRGQLAAIVAGGKAVFHADRARACLAVQDSLTCDRDAPIKYRSDTLDCANVFEGKLASGERCTRSEECISHVCDLNNCVSDGTCCRGLCVGSSPPAVKHANDACTQADVCIDGYCDASAPSPICVPWTADQMPCNPSQQCKPGSGCIGGGAAAVCRPLTPTLGPCGNNSECKSQADACLAGKCDTGGLTGTSCTPAQPNCQDFHWCDTMHNPVQCEAPPALGEDCAASTLCTSGYCHPFTKICTSRLPDGANCDQTTGGQACEGGVCNASNQCASPPSCI